MAKASNSLILRLSLDQIDAIQRFIHNNLKPHDPYQRLLTLLQILKENRYPITAEALSSQLQVSVRSIYRDIESLRDQGAEIIGKPVLVTNKAGLLLPPLAFDENELEALILGLRWVKSNADTELKLSNTGDKQN